jgi:hypothetical protein
MKQMNSRHRRRWSIQGLVRRANTELGSRIKDMAGFFKAATGELRRLNAVGFPERGGGNHTRRERAAMARKALADRYQGHSRCC